MTASSPAEGSILHRRLSRRRALGTAGVGIAAGAAMLATGGCNDGAPENETPKRGGTLRFGTSLPPAYGLDPQIETATGLTIAPKVYGYLFHVDPRDDVLLYDHAERVEQPDMTTYVIHLRRDVRFQDVEPAHGRAVTANDVVRSIERYRTNPLVVARTWFATELDRAEALDDATVRITTRRPYVYSLGELGSVNGGAIIPAEAVDRFLDLGATGAGSGPFVIDGVDDAAVRLRRNPTYFRAPIPHLDAMTWSIFASDADRIAALRALRIDAAPLRDKAEATTIAELTPDLEVTIEPSLSYLSVGLRVDRPPFSDDRVRQALDMAIDRDALIRDVGLGAGTSLGPVNPHLGEGFWALPGREITAALGGASIEERRSKARALLEAAGSPVLWFTLQTPSLAPMIDLASVLREQLSRVGIGVAVEQVDRLRWFLNFRRGGFEATLVNHVPYESPDLPVRFYHSSGVDSEGNAFGFSNAEIDRLVERSWGEADREQRRATLLEAQRLMITSRPMLQLFAGVAHSAAWPYVRNRRPELLGSLAQYHAEQWLELPVPGRPAETH